LDVYDAHVDEALISSFYRCPLILNRGSDQIFHPLHLLKRQLKQLEFQMALLLQ
jgi:hypothetical protein